jgi:hypothetical protein
VASTTADKAIRSGNALSIQQALDTNRKSCREGVGNILLCCVNEVVVIVNHHT